jgi:diacylglycerol O-acyltransferase
MRRLSGIDALFLSVESARWPTHVSTITVVDPSTAPEPIAVDAIKEHLRSRLHLLTPFRRRLVEPPLRIGRQYWIEDPDFDLDFHVRRVGVPYPGGRSELASLVADLASRQLDRGHPLWEWWLLEGLDKGFIANVLKVHHAYIDGVAFAALEELFYDHSPTPQPVPPPQHQWKPDRFPGTLPLLARSFVDLVAIPQRLVRVGASGFSAGKRIRELRPRFDTEETVKPGMPFRSPRVSFNAPVTAHRTWAFATVSLDDIKLVKNAFGVKVNDVVLGMCAGSLRRYLTGRGELPEQPLTASVPVSVRSDDSQALGNQVSGMMVSLATHVDDPVERLQEIYHSSQGSKVMQEALGAEMIMNLADVPPPALLWLATAFYAWAGLARRVPPPFNVMISNVPGPREPLYFLGGEVRAIYSTSVLFDGAGLFIGLASYRDQVDFGITACAELVPDPWTIADGITEELATLVKAAVTIET